MGQLRESARTLRDPTLLLAGLTVLVQIAYPLLDGEALRRATLAVVLLFSSASLAHAVIYVGVAAAIRLLAVTGTLSLAAEALGVRSGVPFGSYHYTGTLGPQLLDVPLVIPLAWTMMAYPCLLLARRLVAVSPTLARLPAWPAVALVGGVALASWDLFLDPQMVAAGHWAFAHPTPGLPGVPGIPLTNYAGWLLVAVVLTGALDRLLPRTEQLTPRELLVPTVLLAWTWLGSALAHLVFLDSPAVAFWGFLGMGVTVCPYLLSLRGRSHVAASVSTSTTAPASTSSDEAVLP